MTASVHDSELLQDYRDLRTTVLHRVRRYDRLNPASYHALFDEGLIPLQSFEQKQPHIVQAFMLTASPWAQRHSTTQQLLDHTVTREQRQDLFARLDKFGARIQPVAGAFVQTNPDKGGLGVGETGEQYKVEFADKTRQLCTALVGMGFAASDMAVYRGGVPDQAMRQAPYSIIALPRLQKQIAVCDQIGEITFVANKPLSLKDWTELSKDELKASPAMTMVRYDREGKWLNAVAAALLDDGKIDLLTRPAVPLPPPAKKPLLTEAGIVRWMELYKEHDDEVKGKDLGKPPVLSDKVVWDKDKSGQWVQVKGENWNALDLALRKGVRSLSGGTSLLQLKQEHGFSEATLPLTPQKIVRWMQLYKEHDDEVKGKGLGRYPFSTDKTVWDKDKSGQWLQVKNENWTVLDLALRRNSRTLLGDSSLLQLKQEHGFSEVTLPLTPQKIVRWIQLYKEHDDEVKGQGLGEYPSQNNKIVWDKDQFGQWIQIKNEKWNTINAALSGGFRSLPGGSSLAQLKQERGLNEDRALTLQKIVRWMQLYKEHDDEVKGAGLGKYPSQEDKIVWDKNEYGKWMQVKGEKWRTINQALRNGLRSLPGGSSLSQLKKEHGFIKNGHTVRRKQPSLVPK
jgi:desulfoferrodoxin (superoxide reductase-like protein)